MPEDERHFQPNDGAIESSLRWHILKRNCQASFTVALIFWALTLLAYVLSWFDLALLTRSGNAVSIQSLLVASLAFSAWAIVYGGRWVFRAIGLAKRGLQAQGTVREIGGVKDFHPLRRLTFSYMHDGRAYRKRMWGGLGAYKVGSTLQVIVNEKKPRRCMLREDVFPPGYDLQAAQDN